MRNALWLLTLFAAAVGIALFAAQSKATVTLFWTPWRIDLSLNLVILLLMACFVLLYFAVRAWSHLRSMPTRARAWRTRQREHAMNSQLRQAMASLLAGRYTHAKTQALNAENSALALKKNPNADQNVCQQVQLLSLLVAAQSSAQMQEELQCNQYLENAARLPLSTSESTWRETIALMQTRLLERSV